MRGVTARRNIISRTLLAAMVALVLWGCGDRDPGPLAGTWRLKGSIPMTIHFRTGESEALGVIDKVSYQVKGNDVVVTYETGISKGSAMRFTMTGPNSARSEMGVLVRVN
jgi:hypothetical protein